VPSTFTYSGTTESTVESTCLEYAHPLLHAVSPVDHFNEVSSLDHVANVVVVGVEQLVDAFHRVGRLACHRHAQRKLDRDVSVDPDLVILAGGGAEQREDHHFVLASEDMPLKLVDVELLDGGVVDKQQDVSFLHLSHASMYTRFRRRHRLDTALRQHKHPDSGRWLRAAEHEC